MILIDIEHAKEVVRDTCKRIPTIAIVTMQRLERLPSYEPKYARWEPIDYMPGRHACSNCRHAAPSFKDGSENPSDYCPACGAKMEEPYEGTYRVD